MNPFFQKLQARWDAGARVCVGFDTDKAKLPESLTGQLDIRAQVPFNREIIQATGDLALADKPNIAFYPTDEDRLALHRTMDMIRELTPEVPAILDAKRADIGNTNRGYVVEAFDSFGADAVTVNPYFGEEALKPFLERDDKGIIVLCRTSNKGSNEFQDLTVRPKREELERWGVSLEDGTGGMPLYAYVAYRVSREWNKHGNCALVVGATYPNELGYVRKIVGDMPILIPGIGTQGGDLEASVKNGVNSKKSGIIINSSSGIIFASKGPEYAEAARKATETLTSDINSVLATV
jgi:orotidine-5'-phosphate decarboxylase